MHVVVKPEKMRRIFGRVLFLGGVVRCVGGCSPPPASPPPPPHPHPPAECESVSVCV